MGKREEMYNNIRVTGFATLIPFVLLSGPIGGYLAGIFLVDKLHLPRYTVLICLALASLASFIQTVRVIRAMIKLDKKQK